MKHIVTLTTLCLAIAVHSACPLTGQDQIVDGKKFTVPAGCVIEKVATSPLIDRPINCDFDGQGRLYVTESSGTNENVKEQLSKKPHRVIRLVDSDGDGKFDKRTVFADKLMFPEGAMWFDGSLYVAAPPQIWKFTDTDDDGVADRREVWFDGKTLTGCANDLHGPYLGPDGWIYWCKGAFAEQTYKKEGQPDWKTRASHIFRRHPSGGPIEAVMTGGMDNPVELVFTADGERIFNSTFLHHPHDGKRDGLVHAIYGGVYGKNHGVLEGHPRTGDLMPVLADHDASAPSGLERLKSKHFGDSYLGNVVCSSFNMHKIFRHRLTYNGSLLQTRNEDLVVCHDLDFHPTDVIEDADGSLLIVDTGGWYKLCCPTSQLHKPDVLGGIYRLRRKDSKVMNDPRGLKLDWSKINPVDRLDDPGFAVRHRARREAARQNRIQELAKIVEKGSEASEEKRLQAVWALSQITSPEARKASRAAILDPSPRVRQAAAHSASAWKDAGAFDHFCNLLNATESRNRRVAAEALGRLGNPRAVTFLLEAAADLKLEPTGKDRALDRGLEHSLIFALIELGQKKQLVQALDDPSPQAQHVALMAASQLKEITLDQNQILPLLDSESPLLQKTAWHIVKQHSEWGDSLTRYFRNRFEQTDGLVAAELEPFIGNPNVRAEMLDVFRRKDRRWDGLKIQLLQVLTDDRKAELVENWKQVPHNLLKRSEAAILDESIRWIKSLAEKEQLPLGNALLAVARNESHSPSLRLLAFSACRETSLSNGDLEFLMEHLKLDHQVTLRGLAVESIQRARLNQNQQKLAARLVQHAGPMEVIAVSKKLAKDASPELDQVLLQSLSMNKSIEAIDPAQLKQALSRLASNPEFQKVLARIEERKASNAERLEKILALMPQANVRRGQEVFHSNQASCIACHQMGYLGGRIGPSLSRIGRIRSERDLLESLMFPSISFVRSYEPVVVETIDGRMFSGIIKDETEEVLELTLDARKSVRINKSDIENRKVGKQSVMPSGLDQQFSDQQLADLIRFLKESG